MTELSNIGTLVTIDLSCGCMYSSSQPHNECCTFYETVFGIIYKASKTMGNIYVTNYIYSVHCIVVFTLHVCVTR